MSIGISEEHVELAAQPARVGGSLGRARGGPAMPTPTPDATFPEAWKGCVEMGVATIGLPETAGGGGGTVLDVAVALEACAHELVPGPLLSTAVAASLLGETPFAGDPRRGRRRGHRALSPRPCGDLAGATHVLAPDGDEWRIAPIASAEPALGIDRQPPVRRGRRRATATWCRG